MRAQFRIIEQSNTDQLAVTFGAGKRAVTAAAEVKEFTYFCPSDAAQP